MCESSQRVPVDTLTEADGIRREQQTSKSARGPRYGPLSARGAPGLGVLGSATGLLLPTPTHGPALSGMTIQDAHEKLYKVVRHPFELTELAGATVAVDIASWMLRAFYADAPSFFRPGARPTHSYRDFLSRLLSVLSLATGSAAAVIVVVDGARYWPKAAEHARRGTAVDRERIIADAKAADDNGNRTEADKLYRELTYPVPDELYSWLVGHCSRHELGLVVAPFDADAQCAWLALNGIVDHVLTIDGDFPIYGIPSVIFSDTTKKETY